MGYRGGGGPSGAQTALVFKMRRMQPIRTISSVRINAS